MEAFFEVEVDGIFVTDTITDDTIVLDRANELYTSMKKRVDDSCSEGGLVDKRPLRMEGPKGSPACRRSLRMERTDDGGLDDSSPISLRLVIRTEYIGDIVINLR